MLRTDRYVGIDIGVSISAPGAVAVLLPDGTVSHLTDLPIETIQVPVKANKSGVGVRSYLDLGKLDHLFKQLFICQHTNLINPEIGVEEQVIYGTDGRRSGGVLMRTFGQVEGLIVGYGQKFKTIRPKVWQAEFNLTGDKDSHLNLARELFPVGDMLKRKKDHGRADALLIAEYIRRQGEASNG